MRLNMYVKSDHKRREYFRFVASVCPSARFVYSFHLEGDLAPYISVITVQNGMCYISLEPESPVD